MTYDYKKVLVLLFIIGALLLAFVSIGIINYQNTPTAPVVKLQSVTDLSNYFKNNYSKNVDLNYFSNSKFILCGAKGTSDFIKPDCVGMKDNTFYFTGSFISTIEKQELESNVIKYLIENNAITEGEEYKKECTELFTEEAISQTNSSLTDCSISVSNPGSEVVNHSVSIFYFNKDKETINFLVTSPSIPKEEFEQFIIGDLASLSGKTNDFKIINTAYAGGEGGGGEGAGDVSLGGQLGMIAADAGAASLSGHTSVGNIGAAIAGGMVATGPNSACCNEKGDGVTGFEGGEGGVNNVYYNDTGSCPLASLWCPRNGDCVCQLPPPPPVVSVSCHNVAGNQTAFVNWANSPRAIYYQIKLNPQGNNSAPYLLQNDVFLGVAFSYITSPGSTYTTWVSACAASGMAGCSPATSVDFSCPVPTPPPVVTLSASALKVNSGGASTLTWTATDATSCVATGGWSGNKSPFGSSEAVYPTANTTYNLSCTGPGGTTNATPVTILVPSGSLSVSNCTILADASSCDSTIDWVSKDFIGSTEVKQSYGAPFNGGATSGSLPRPVTLDDRSFTLRDTVGSFSITRDASVNCASNSIWVGAIPLCMRLPVISITANPNVIRNGNTAPLNIDITANYDMTCTLKGGINQTFSHSASASARTYNTYQTNPLTAGQVVTVSCVNDTYPAVTGAAETKIEVTSTYQET